MIAMKQTAGPPIRFKDRVAFKRSPSGIEIRYEQQGLSLSVSNDTQAEIYHLLNALQLGEHSRSQLVQLCANMQAQVPDLLNALAQRGMLREGDREPINAPVLTGRQFYQDLTQFLTRLKQQFPPSPLSQRLADKALSRQQVIGYALESYQVTHLCPRLLAPALAHWEPSTTQNHLQDFFVSELHHDQLLAKALNSVGITRSDLKQRQPLPMTFAVCASLCVFAQQHPLSFKAALILFEEDEAVFYDLFVSQCQALNLPADFYRPILHHAHINDEGGHDQLTQTLMENIPYVSFADQQRVKKNMTLLMESMILRTYEILDYYGSAEVNPLSPLSAAKAEG